MFHTRKYVLCWITMLVLQAVTAHMKKAENTQHITNTSIFDNSVFILLQTHVVQNKGLVLDKS
jgi:hypothetical protein